MWLNKAQTLALADRYGRLDYARARTLDLLSNGLVGEGCGECPACRAARAFGACRCIWQIGSNPVAQLATKVAL